MPDAYTTKTRVKGYLSIADGDVSHDTELDELIAGVSSVFDKVTGRSFTQEELTEFHDGLPVGGGIPLYQIPSEDATDRGNITVAEDGAALTVDVDWFIGSHPAQSIWRLDGAGNQGMFNFALGTRNIEVTYLTEFKVLPDDIALAATEEVVRRFKHLNTTAAAGDNRIGVVSISPETGTGLSFAPDDLSPATLRTLNSYRLRRFI